MTHAIALTPGEPAGIGPDITVQIAQRAQAEPIVVYADPALLLARAEQLQLPLQLHPITHEIPTAPAPIGSLYIRAYHCAASVSAGNLDTKNAHYVLQCLQAAANDCLQQP